MTTLFKTGPARPFTPSQITPGIPAPTRFDDYSVIEYLEDQVSPAGGLLTFNFTSAVQLAVITLESLSPDPDAQDMVKGRVTSGGIIATDTKGAILRHSVPVNLLGSITSLSVKVPANTVCTVYGSRR